MVQYLLLFLCTEGYAAAEVRIWGYSSVGRAKYPVSDPKGCYKITSFDKIKNSQKVVE